MTRDITAPPKLKLFLVPVGAANDHQRTIDGLSPVGACWGCTDGSQLVQLEQEETGSVLVFIRAMTRVSAAHVYRLGEVESCYRDPQLAGTLYKTQHTYNMGEFFQARYTLR